MAKERYARIDLKLVENNPWQPREIFPRDRVESLAESIKTLGMIEPVVGREHPTKKGMYQMAAGAMRKEANTKAGIDKIPMVIRELDNKQMRLYALAENIQRTDMTDMEKEKAYYTLWEDCYDTGSEKEMGIKAMAKELGIAYQTLMDSISAYETRKVTKASEDISSSDLHMVAALVKEGDIASAKKLVKHIERDELGSLEVKRLAPIIRQTPKDMRGAAIDHVVQGSKESKDYAETIIKEVEAGPQTKLRKESLDYEVALKRLQELAKDIRIYGTETFLATIRDHKARLAGFKILQDITSHLEEELLRVQKTGWYMKGEQWGDDTGYVTKGGNDVTSVDKK